MSPRQLCLSPLAIALAGALVLGACGQHDEPVAGDTPVQAQGAPAATADAAPRDDAAITQSITAELSRDGALDPSRIDIDTAQGRVVLRGSAPDEAAKDRAKRIALAVAGVKAVDNYLTVPQS